MFSVKKVMDGLKKDVNELRCVEQKLSRQLELIQKPLREQSKSISCQPFVYFLKKVQTFERNIIFLFRYRIATQWLWYFIGWCINQWEWSKTPISDFILVKYIWSVRTNYSSDEYAQKTFRCSQFNDQQIKICFLQTWPHR